jgi:AraC-like DNA-binding protein
MVGNHVSAFRIEENNTYSIKMIQIRYDVAGIQPDIPGTYDGSYWHLRHPTRVVDHYVLIVVRRSVLSIKEEDLSYELSPGESFLLRPGKQHSGTQDYPADLLFDWLHWCEQSPDENLSLSLPQHGVINSMARYDMLKSWYDDWYHSGSRIMGTGQGLIHLMLQCIEPKSDSMSMGEVLSRKAKEWLEKHYFQNISTFEVAEVMGVSPDHLGRVFKSTYGLTIVQELQRLKLLEACHRLIQSRDSVEDIALKVGLGSSRYLARLFKKVEGCSPQEYRKRYTNQG